MYDFSQQGYANFLHNQRFSETASLCVLGGRMNKKDVSNAYKILTQPNVTVNCKPASKTTLS